MCVCVCVTGRFAVGHCTASHCIRLYKEISLKRPKSPFALIYRDGRRWRGWLGDGLRARIVGRKRFLCSSLSSSWRASSSCFQSALRLLFFFFFLSLSSWLWLSLFLRLHATSGLSKRVWDVVRLCVLLLNVSYATLLTTLRCWGCLAGSQKEPNSMHWMRWTQKNRLASLIFFVYIYSDVCGFVFRCDKYRCCQKQVQERVISFCFCLFLKSDPQTWVCIRCVCLWE